MSLFPPSVASGTTLVIHFDLVKKTHFSNFETLFSDSSNHQFQLIGFFGEGRGRRLRIFVTEVQKAV